MFNTSVLRLNHIMNHLAPVCTMCCKRIANKDDMKRHMTFKAAKGNKDAKFLVNA